MATGAYSGKTVLLKLGTGETAVPIMTAKSNGFTITNSTVDTSNKKANGWGAILPGGGTKECTITLEGTFENESYDKQIRGYGFDGSSNAYVLVTGNGDKYAGKFIITSYAVGGTYNEAETYSISLRNDGEVTYTPSV